MTGGKRRGGTLGVGGVVQGQHVVTATVDLYFLKGQVRQRCQSGRTKTSFQDDQSLVAGVLQAATVVRFNRAWSRVTSAVHVRGAVPKDQVLLAGRAEGSGV